MCTMTGLMPVRRPTDQRRDKGPTKSDRYNWISLPPPFKRLVMLVSCLVLSCVEIIFEGQNTKKKKKKKENYDYVEM